MTTNISILILAAVFFLIAQRQVFRIRLRIWQIMLAGALSVLLTGQISLPDAVIAINPDVMLFLFGMFVVGTALEESGYLAYLSHGLFRRVKNVDQLILVILFSMGILSALLMNDTLAIIGTPLVLHVAKKHNISPVLLLMALAFGITTGSAMSPIGNPQNLLIAMDGNMANPFLTFFSYLAIPSFINLFLAYVMLKLFFRRHFTNIVINHHQDPIHDFDLASLSRISLIIIILSILAKIATVFLVMNVDFRLTYIALAAAFPILVFSPRRNEIFIKTDWHTLIFFAAMFILMTAVWDSGFFQGLITDLNLDITATGMVLVISVLMSQLLSNVPLVALYMPMLVHAGTSTGGLMALAAGSTIAGNLLILGAASNIIIIQNAEKKGVNLTFFQFAKVGVPLSAVHILVYWIFLS